MSYLLIKWIHIVSATILFGTGVGIAFHMFMASRHGKVEEIYFAARNVDIADWLFTAPAVIVQFVSGVTLVNMLGYSFSDTWIAWGVALYLFAAACWLPVVLLQIWMRNIAEAALKAGEPLPARYWRLERWWTILGTLAFPAILAVFYLMVFKPAG